MRLSEIQRFFEEFDRRLNSPVRVLLTGGAAAIIMGVHRATQDIDFEIQLRVPPRLKQAVWQKVQAALSEVAQVTRITPQFSEDIDRWSSISLPVKKSHLWQKI